MYYDYYIYIFLKDVIGRNISGRKIFVVVRLDKNQYILLAVQDFSFFTCALYLNHRDYLYIYIFVHSNEIK